MDNITPEAFWTIISILSAIAVIQNVKERKALRKVKDSE
ncbi:membrane protein [Arthrobacter phage Kardesai]|uniref:Membrane protein n=1 Tax=Arthrobacter phage Kardesai TaxID=2859474 RepID=A0AAE7SM69_9CAUD|nr:membrane protein [Arthrobacter phage Kardesai]QXO12950.1 membrane protein [Arthrobacter phage Kardesai]